jgi:hypothetical protein
MTDPSAATWSAPVPLPRRPEAPPRTLRSLLDEGIPDAPVPGLDGVLDALEERLGHSRRERDEQQAALLRRADDLVRDLHTRLATAEAQVRRLERLLFGFEELGEFGTEGAAEAEGHLRRLRAYRDELRSMHGAPALQEAREGMRTHLETERERVVSRLNHDGLADEMDPIVDGILGILDPADTEWAGRAIDAFERDVREWRRFHHLPAIQRFWSGLSERLRDADPVGAAEAQGRAEALAAEIVRRRQDRELSERARREALEIREAVADLQGRGPEEINVLMHTWLGRLRRYQDDFELDEGVRKEIYQTFGAVNRARKDLGVEGFIDALNRKFRTDWSEYVRLWEMKLESARAQDRRDAEEDERLDRERQERERQTAEERAASEARLRELTAILEEQGGGSDWRTDADVREDVKEMLLSGVDEGGCQSEPFLAAARRFAPLAHGAEFRKLRRSLAKRGVRFDEIELIEPERPDSPDEELFRRLAPVWRGKTVAIVGGLPREQVRRRVEEGLGLKEARWYEYYRVTCQQEQAESAIRSGAIDLVLLLIRYAGHKINEVRETARSCGVECRVIDRGCGVTSILRGLETAGAAVARG